MIFSIFWRTAALKQERSVKKSDNENNSNANLFLLYSRFRNADRT